MMIKDFSFSRHSPIGIDLGEHSIKAAQLERVGKHWRLSRLVNIPRQNPGTPIQVDELNRMINVLHRSGFSGLKAVLSVPRADLLTAMLELPPRTAEVPLDQIARMEFSRVHKCEPAMIELSCWDLPEPLRVNKATHLMATGYSHAKADQYLDLIEQSGLNVIAMDTTASALARACLSLSRGATTAMLDLGHGESLLALWQTVNLTYERRLSDVGVGKLLANLGKQLEIEADEAAYVLQEGGLGETGERRGEDTFIEARRIITAHFAPLVQELSMTFSYSDHQYPQDPVKTLLLAGGGAMIPGLAAHLQQALSIEVRVAQVADVIECVPQVLSRATPTVITALGLAEFEEQ